MYVSRVEKNLLSVAQLAGDKLWAFDFHLKKSSFLISAKAALSRRNLIKTWTGFQLLAMPIKYQGVPLFKGRSKLSYFHELESSIR